MEQTLRQMAGQIMIQALAAVQPDAAVRSALEQAELSGRVYLVAIGKAAWQMANAAYQTLGARITDGVVITKLDIRAVQLAALPFLRPGTRSRMRRPLRQLAMRWL